MDWSATLQGLARQVPDLVVLVFIVVRFLGHIAVRDAQFAETLKSIGDNCHEVQETNSRKTDSALLDVSGALKDNSKVLGEVRGLLIQQARRSD